MPTPGPTLKRTLSLAVIIAFLVSALGIALTPDRALAEHPGAIPLFSAPFMRTVAAGQHQKIWIHTLALANVTLKVNYGNGQEVRYSAKTDVHGIHQFEWTVGYTGSKVTLARYWVYVKRGALHSSMRGDFVLFPAPPFQLSVDILTPNLHAGDTLRLRVHTLPYVALTLTILDDENRDLLTLSDNADAHGTWDVSATVSTTVTQPQRMKVIVEGQNYGRHEQVTTAITLHPYIPSQPGNPTTPIQAPSLDKARQQARAAANGSFVVARQNAQDEVQLITIQLQVLGQFSLAGVPHTDSDYYKTMLAHASSYDDYIDVTARTAVDDAVVQALMRRVMPHKVIMVSLDEQALRAYEDGHMVLFSYVTTGRPELPTVTGHFHIYEKVSPYKFISPWPPGSPYYYPPTWIKYWMPFYEGYGLHDAWWRAHYGPGTNIYGDGPYSGEPTGTHGCVNIPLQNTIWLWNWAPVGTPVVVYGHSGTTQAHTAGI